MKKLNLLIGGLALASLGVAPVSLRAACGTATNNLIANGLFGNFFGVTGTIGTDITGHFWGMGAGNPATGLGNDDGTRIFTGASGWFQPIAGTQYYAAANWADTGVDGCVGAQATNDTIILINHRTGEGTAAHAGRFYIQRVGWKASTNYDPDFTTNGVANAGCPGGAPNCQMNGVSIPVPAIQTVGGGATYNRSTGAGSVRISFTVPAEYITTGTAATTPLISAFEIYQITGTTAPTTSNATGWGTALATTILNNATDCPAGACSKLITINTIPSVAGNVGYLAVRPVFDGATPFKTDFVSGNSAPIAGPLAVEGLPTAIELYPTRVNSLPGFQVRWSSTNESEIAGYRILASLGGGEWVTLQDHVSTKGPGTYTELISRRTLVARLGSAPAYQLKVIVLKRDGSSVDAGQATYAFTPRTPRVRAKSR